MVALWHHEKSRISAPEPPFTMSIATPAVPQASTRKAFRDPSIDYLRAFVVQLVLLTHCGLAYSNSLRTQTEWNSLVPIVDPRQSSTMLSYLFNFADIFLMSLMFFISALFVYPALRRHGIAGFLRDRFFRLGLPFVGAVVFLLPLGYYAAWLLAHRDGSYGTFWLALAHNHFNAVGPAWFLWVLLFFDCLLAAAFLLLRKPLETAAARFERLGGFPGRVALLMFAVSTLAYLPLFARHGYAYFGGWRYIVSPFLLEPTRLPVYLVWSFAGFLAGFAGLERGLLAPSGPLVRRWPLWTALAIIVFNLQWIAQGSPAIAAARSASPHIFLGVVWVATDVACVFGFLALFRGVVRVRRPVLDSLARCSYVLYLVHYIYVLWTQRLLLDMPVGAFAKFSISFLLTLTFSWATALLLIRVPGLRRIL